MTKPLSPLHPSAFVGEGVGVRAPASEVVDNVNFDECLPVVSISYYSPAIIAAKGFAHRRLGQKSYRIILSRRREVVVVYYQRPVSP
ncbi:MAG TPA: hypothetical protein IGS52_23300 [Oscillatoriaceae cyanobacterium M33_DOE_052]|uniref:Uncharacterized protein n=1 Tax=Planktothricoides sp. SpSt-374 TaxID=2282167 RepID=A0A7C3ZPT1_9CYAN|nr:hypothetical protein [Oscillatoriaceae cyanobacterium M33_DOE_052]